MREAQRFLHGILMLVPAACGGAPAVAPLHERRSFAGTVRVEVREGSTRFSGEADLAFDRGNGNFQVAVRAGGHTVAWNRLESGEVRRFVDGIPTGGASGDGREEAAARMFELLERLCRPPDPGARIERRQRGYVLVQGDRTVRVELLPARGVHGAGGPETGRSPLQPARRGRPR